MRPFPDDRLVSSCDLAEKLLQVVHPLRERNSVEFFAVTTVLQAAIGGGFFSAGNANGHRLFRSRFWFNGS